MSQLNVAKCHDALNVICWPVVCCVPGSVWHRAIWFYGGECFKEVGFYCVPVFQWAYQLLLCSVVHIGSGPDPHWNVVRSLIFLKELSAFYTVSILCIPRSACACTCTCAIHFRSEMCVCHKHYHVHVHVRCQILYRIVVISVPDFRVPELKMRGKHFATWITSTQWRPLALFLDSCAARTCTLALLHTIDFAFYFAGLPTTSILSAPCAQRAWQDFMVDFYMYVRWDPYTQELMLTCFMYHWIWYAGFLSECTRAYFQSPSHQCDGIFPKSTLIAPGLTMISQKMPPHPNHYL